MEIILFSVTTLIGWGIGAYFEAPILGAILGFIVGVALRLGAVGEIADIATDIID